jgi:DNA-binding MarR family transcriptional regulator
MLGFSASKELGYLLKKVQHELRRLMDQSLREIDLTTPQYSLLSSLAEFPGISSAELARKCFVTAQTMNLIVQNLESRGLIAREPKPDHGRVLTTALTEEGQTLLKAATLRVLEIEKTLFSNLAEIEQSELSRLLSKIA